MSLETHQNGELILASASPRRRALLTLFRLPFEVKVAPVDETPLASETPTIMAKRLAVAKAEAVAVNAEAATVIGADTVVVAGGDVLGKPADKAEACHMLQQLRGRAHEVVSGIAVIRMASGLTIAATALTRVVMRDYSDAEIAAYITSGDPFDKAGAYAIQHPGFHPVDHIEGSYSNVVGLPLCELLNLLREASIPLEGLSCEQLEESCFQMFPFSSSR